MRVNSRVFTEKSDLFDSIKIPNCPSEIRAVAESVMMLVTAPGYSTPTYRNVTQLDKIITWEYWLEVDGMRAILNNPSDMKGWFVNKATSPDLISRSMRWLTSHNYLLLDPAVQERAMASKDRWQKSMSR